MELKAPSGEEDGLAKDQRDGQGVVYRTTIDRIHVCLIRFVTVAANGLHAQKYEKEDEKNVSESMRGRVGNRAPYCTVCASRF